MDGEVEGKGERRMRMRDLRAMEKRVDNKQRKKKGKL